ncbi:hypothetical protein BDM02DRAFT_3132346 [Thelephora ganbajun]|uniref:Uncharacterized protein n=1 Tax=Thelephora ganbajun TaxID=370292 RepID=A0ACB6Z247_THEGA|nr:hypothetical protein BDM02DRAFT_3132346 [Thelephora ganbajun]
MLASSLDLLVTAHNDRLGHLESRCFEQERELGELRVRMLELELAWEQRALQASLEYASAAGEGVVMGEEEVVEGGIEEEEAEMDEEGLWSPNSSDRAVLALERAMTRGTFHAMEGIEVYNGPIEVSMGYTSSVGIMLAEEIALTNDVVGAVSVTTRGTRSHESLRLFTEMELANRDLTIGLLRARLNTVAPMEIDLTTVEEEEEYISAPGTLPPSGHTSTTDVSIRVETPELVIPEGVLIPIEDSSEEDGEGEVVIPDEIEAPEPLGIILPCNTFNWQDERAQGQEEYYRRQREEEERAREEPEFVPPPQYDDLFPDVIEADRVRYMARYSDGRPTGERGPSDAGPSGTTHDD